MPTIERQDPWELLEQAITLLDEQITELKTRRAQLATLTGSSVAVAKPIVKAPGQQRTMSAEAKAKISAAAKKRWAQKKKAAKAAQSAAPAVSAVKSKPAKDKPAPAKPKQPAVKEAKPAKATKATKPVKAVKAVKAAPAAKPEPIATKSVKAVKAVKAAPAAKPEPTTE